MQPSHISRGLPLLVAMFALCSAVLLLAPPAQASGDAAAAKGHAGGAAAQPHKETYNEAVAQADGISDAVVDHLWLETDHFWHHGDYNRIVALCRICVEEDPMFTEAYGDAAWLLWSMGDMSGADRFLDYGVKRRPQLSSLQFEFGFHLYNTKRYDAALPHFQAAVQNPNAPVLDWKMLAHCYDRLGNYAKSADTWKTVIKKFPDEAVAAHNLQEVEAKLHAQQAGGAAPVHQ